MSTYLKNFLCLLVYLVLWIFNSLVPKRKSLMRDIFYNSDSLGFSFMRDSFLDLQDSPGAWCITAVMLSMPLRYSNTFMGWSRLEYHNNLVKACMVSDLSKHFYAINTSPFMMEFFVSLYFFSNWANLISFLPFTALNPSTMFYYNCLSNSMFIFIWVISTLVMGVSHLGHMLWEVEGNLLIRILGFICSVFMFLVGPVAAVLRISVNFFIGNIFVTFFTELLVKIGDYQVCNYFIVFGLLGFMLLVVLISLELLKVFIQSYVYMLMMSVSMSVAVEEVENSF